MNLKITKIIIAFAITILATNLAMAQESDIAGVWDGWYEANQGKTKLTLTIYSDMTGIFEFTNMPGMSNVSPGSYTIVVDYSNNSYRIVGREWIERPYMYGFLDLNGKISNGKFSGKTEQGKRFQLERIATAQQLQEQQAEQERQFKIQQAEQERELQARKAEQDRTVFLILFSYGVGMILIVVFLIRFRRKAMERRKEYQPVFINMFKEKGLSATDILWTNCKQIIRKNTREYTINNIVFGVKNDVLSVFGGGSFRTIFGVEDEKIAFGIPRWKKLLKETDDILLADGYAAKILFPKKEEKQFKHLFDIPINSIGTIEGRDRGKKIELFIEYFDNLITITPYCANKITAIETINTIIDVFDKMMSGALSKAKIHKANLTINDAYKQDSKITEKRNLKILGAVVGTAVAIGGVAAASGARNWSKDR